MSTRHNALERKIEFRKEYRPESSYQVCLNNIKLLPGAAPPSSSIKRPQEHILTGAVVEHSPRYWSDSFADVAITQMTSTDGLNAPLQFWDQSGSQRPPLIALKEALLSLLSQPDTWSSIELDHVFFYKNQQINHAVTQSFYDDFLIALAKNASLKKLTLRPLSLAEHGKSLVCFLAQDTELESLVLQINEAYREDWFELCKVLGRHPKLNSLHLDHSVLDSDAYSALTSLLDKNYRIEIKLSEPKDEYLLGDHRFLRPCLSEKGFIRFKEHHLSQDKLLQVAITALDSLQELKSSRIDSIKEKTRFEKQFDFLVTNEGYLALTSHGKEAWLKEASVLPDVYVDYKEYMKKYSRLVHLHLDKFIKDRGKTVGYLLLEKVLETANVKAMKSLLEANVNLLECPAVDDKDPFLPRLFRGEKHPALQKIVLQHMAEDSSLVELALERFSAYSEIGELFEKFGTKMSQYANILVYKIDPPLLTLFARNILDLCRKALHIEPPSKKRKEEYGKIHVYIAKILQLVENDGQVKLGYHSFTKAQKIVQEMIAYSSRAAARGISGRSFLHDGIVAFAEDFHQKLEDSKGNIVDEHEDIIVQQSSDLKEKDTTINDLLETIKRQQKDLNEQHKQEKKQLQQELAKHKKREAAMQAEIERLKRLAPAQNSTQNQISEETAPQDQESPGGSTHFFPRR